MSIHVRLLVLCEGQRNIFSILGFHFLNLSPDICLVFVGKNVVCILKCGFDFSGIKLNQECGRQVVSKWYIVVSSVLAYFLQCLVVARNEKGTCVDYFGSM